MCIFKSFTRLYLLSLLMAQMTFIQVDVTLNTKQIQMCGHYHNNNNNKNDDLYSAVT